MRIGLISDTHGLLRPEAAAFLRGCDHILHAGDIGKPEVIEALAAIAPLTAVRGNVDKGEWAAKLTETEMIQLGDVILYVLHDRSELDLDPKAASIAVVVSGHSHQPRIDEHEGVLYVNPGSAGPRRFKLPIALAELHIEGTTLAPRIVELNVK